MENTGDKQLDELVAGILRGDQETLRLLKNRLGGYARKHYFGDSMNIEDVVADIMELIYSNLRNNRFRGDNLRALEVYMLNTARNYITNRAKKSTRLRFFADSPEQITRSSSRIDTRLVRKDLSDKILSAMDEKCRKLMTMKFLEAKSDQEIADKYGKSKNAISTAISRCVTRARELDLLG